MPSVPTSVVSSLSCRHKKAADDLRRAVLGRPILRDHLDSSSVD